MLKTIEINKITKQAGNDDRYRNYVVEAVLTGDETKLERGLMIRVQWVADCCEDKGCTPQEAMQKLIKREASRLWALDVKSSAQFEDEQELKADDLVGLTKISL